MLQSTGDFGVLHGMQGVLFDDGVGYEPCPTPSFVDQIIETGDYTTLVTFLATSDLLQQEFARAGAVSKYSAFTIRFESLDLILTHCLKICSCLWSE